MNEKDRQAIRQLTSLIADTLAGALQSIPTPVSADSPELIELAEQVRVLVAAQRGKRETEERLRFLTVHDSLTGLYNRAYFTEEMARLERGRHYPVSILVADLDGLKEINDSMGHQAGDQLLVQAAEALVKGVRSDDMVARIGGDEFAVLLLGADESIAANILDRIRDYIRYTNEEGEPLLSRCSPRPTTLRTSGCTATRRSVRRARRINGGDPPPPRSMD
jgi:diguanylate cyclase (GGDEF)-like protein